MTLMFIGGVFLHGGFTCLYALATQAYPSDVRAAGVGWAAGWEEPGHLHRPCWRPPLFLPAYVQPVPELRLAAGYRRTASLGVCR